MVVAGWASITLRYRTVLSDYTQIMKRRQHKESLSPKHNAPISLHPLSIEEALKQAMDAGPMPKKGRGPKDTKSGGPQRSPQAPETAQHPRSSGG